MMLVDYSKLETHINVYSNFLEICNSKVGLQSVWEIAREFKNPPDFEKIFKKLVIDRVKDILATQYDVESLEVSQDGMFIANSIVLEKLSDFKKLSKKFIQEGETV